MKIRNMVWAIAVALALTGSAHAGRDMTYVEGLIVRGYYELAVEHLNEMRTRVDVSAEDKLLIPLKLGSINSALAAREPDPQAKERYLAEASRHLEEFSRRSPRHPNILDVSLQQVDILSSRAQASEMRHRAETDVKKKQDLRKETENLYRKSLRAAQVIVDEATARVKDLRPKASRNNRYMKEYWLYYGAQVRGLFLLGHVEYLWAQLYPKKHAKRKKHLEAGMKHFKTAIKQRPKTNVTFDSHVRRGMCLRELAVFEKNSKAAGKKRRDALSAFITALTVESTPQTMSTRAEAQYQKAITAYQLGDYEAAVSAAEGFFRERPQAKNSYRGQETLLVKARSLGRLAKAQLDRKQSDWENIYNEARRAVKDILPDYPDIREAADKLVQSWGPMFPTRREVVMSPLIAAAEAKKFYRDNKLDEAVEKYREVITLSGGHEAYADFAEEAWKTVGKIYYDSRRLYMSAIAWRELLVRFPDTHQGVEIAWIRTRTFRHLYSEGGKDDFDLDEYLASLRFFIERYPKDPRVFEAQTESAKVYAIRGEVVKSAEIWSRTDPANARYAESMSNSGELYWQAFVKLAENKKGRSRKAREYLSLTAERLRSAADAKLPEGAGKNYNAQALARFAEILTGDAVPQPESARKVPALVTEFRRRFPNEDGLMPTVLLAGARAHVVLKKPREAEKLALDIEKKYLGGYAYEAVKQLMVVAFQKVDPARANVWQRKQVGDLKEAKDSLLETLGNRAWQQGDHNLAAKCFTVLVGRYRTRNSRKHLEYEHKLAAVLFEAGEFGKAVPFYRRFLNDVRKRFKSSNSVPDRNELLLSMRRLAESEEMGGDPKRGIELWNEFCGMVFKPDPPKEWFEARYHLANCYYRLKQYNAAKSVVKRVEVLYDGFGDDPELRKKVDALRKKLR